MSLITAEYKGKKVKGRWFCLGDSFYLLLTPESTQTIGVEAIDIDDLTNISRGPY